MEAATHEIVFTILQKLFLTRLQELFVIMNGIKQHLNDTQLAIKVRQLNLNI